MCIHILIIHLFFYSQVHDELVFEVRTMDVPRVARIVKECMEGAVLLNVPLSVKLSTGVTWGSLTPLTLLDTSIGSSGGNLNTTTKANVRESRTSPAFPSDSKGLSPDPVSDHFSLYHTVMSRANSLLPVSTAHVGETERNHTSAVTASATALYPLIHQRATSNPNLPPSQINNNNNSTTIGGGNAVSSKDQGLSLPIVRDLFGRD